MNNIFVLGVLLLNDSGLNALITTATQERIHLAILESVVIPFDEYNSNAGGLPHPEAGHFGEQMGLPM